MVFPDKARGYASKLLWLLVALLSLTVVAVAFYKAWPLLHPELVAVAPLDPACDLHLGSCTGQLPNGGRITFAITPNAIPVVAPLHLTVQVDGLNARGVEVDFQGLDMNMGFNRPRLQAVARTRFEGDGMLPVCVRRHMDWEARVLVKTDQGLMAAPFRFATSVAGR